MLAIILLIKENSSVNFYIIPYSDGKSKICGPYKTKQNFTFVCKISAIIKFTGSKGSSARKSILYLIQLRNA